MPTPTEIIKIALNELLKILLKKKKELIIYLLGKKEIAHYRTLERWIIREREKKTIEYYREYRIFDVENKEPN